MYFSKKHKFVFMHINKTGGRSLTSFLQDVIPDLRPTALGHKAIHKPYSWLMDRNLIPRGYRVVTIIRNPWKRYESLYRYRRMKYANGMVENGSQNQDAYNMEFNVWFRHVIQSSDPLNRFQCDWLPDSEKERKRLLLLRLENLEEDTLALLHNIEAPIVEFPEFPHLNKSPDEEIDWDLKNIVTVRCSEGYIIHKFYDTIGGENS